MIMGTAFGVDISRSPVPNCNAGEGPGLQRCVGANRTGPSYCRRLHVRLGQREGSRVSAVQVFAIVLESNKPFERVRSLAGEKHF